MRTSITARPLTDLAGDIQRPTEADDSTLYTRRRATNRFVVLTPSLSDVPGVFRNVEAGHGKYRTLLAQMQRLRGRIYTQDGAVRRDELTSDGRHRPGADERCWHVLTLDANDNVVACLRYLDQRGARGFDDLCVRHAALARCPASGGRLRGAVESAMERARYARVAFGEVGGWAVAEAQRLTLEPLRIILATYGLLQLLGGSVGVATATFRHGSAAILRKIGLGPLVAEGDALPPYYDPHYDCQMEILGYDSRYPNPKYLDWVRALGAEIANSPVICGEAALAAVA